MASKNTESTKETTSAKTSANIDDEPKMTLANWCSQRSHGLGRSIEVLSGFQFVERNTLELLPASKWESKFQAFLKTPV
jgi:hypothetical protein